MDPFTRFLYFYRCRYGDQGATTDRRVNWKQLKATSYPQFAKGKTKFGRTTIENRKDKRSIRRLQPQGNRAGERSSGRNAHGIIRSGRGNFLQRFVPISKKRRR